MLDSIAKLGEELLNESPDSFLENLVKYRGKGILLRIIFDVDERNIEFDKIELNESRCKKYLWIGNTLRAAREPVLRLTSNNLKYLLREGDGIDGIINAINGFPIEFRMKERLKQLYYYLKTIKDTFGDLEKAVGDANADVYTISIRINNQEIDLATTDGYKDFLEIILLRRYDTKKGLCYLCGSESVLIDPGFPSGSLLKMYVLDKKGFLSGISDTDISKMKTFSICPECLKNLLTGVSYIERNLQTTIGDINLYLIPRSSISIRKFRRFLDFVKDRFDTVKSYKKLIRFDKILSENQDYREYARDEASYTLNLIFGKREQASFNFYDEITEVPVTNLTLYGKYAKYLTKKVSEILGDEENLNIDFEGIYRIFPLSLRKTRRGVKLEGYSPLIQLYSSLLNRQVYPEEELMKRALLFVRIHRYGLYGAYNIKEIKDISKRDTELSYGMVKYNMILRILKDDLITSDNKESGKSSSDEELIAKYFELNKYEDWQKALFLLGYLIGQVGSKQYSKGDKKKSILSKINFNGMSKHKVMALSNEILDSLRNYRILEYNEKIYAEMKYLLDRNLEKISDPIRNTFYILSGYAFSTIKTISYQRGKI